MVRRVTPKLLKPYSLGAYNDSNKEEQWIRLTEGCPNNCPYCAEPQEIKVFNIPKIIRNNVKILDMNLLCKKESLKIIKELGKQRVNGKVIYYELSCGIDYRFLTPELAKALKENRFIKVRLAWDWYIYYQKQIRKAIKILSDVGYRPEELTLFMICNWLVPYKHNLFKLDLCKVWSVKVADCYFDNQLSPHIKPIHWKPEEIKDFRKKVRKHNQLINFKIDPELKGISNLTLKYGSLDNFIQ